MKLSKNVALYNIAVLSHASMFRSESVNCVRTREWAVLGLMLQLDQLQ